MSLLDIDKDNLDRSNPMPDVHNQITSSAVMAHSTASSHFSLSLPDGYLQQRNKQFIANDGNTNTALMGYNAALDKWGFFTTEDGVDVTTNTDLSKFTFNSGNDTFKIIDTNTFSFLAADFASSGNTYLTELASYSINYPAGAHKPIVLVFYEDAAGDRTPLPFYSFDYDTGALDYIARQRIADSGTIVEVRATAALSPGVSFRYYTLQETSA